jgi:hypothetical protein
MSLSRTLALPCSSLPPLARLLLQRLNRLQHGSLRLHTPDGQCLRFGQSGEMPEAELHIHDWAACRKLLFAGDIGFAEAYRDGLLDSPDSPPCCDWHFAMNPFWAIPGRQLAGAWLVLAETLPAPQQPPRQPAQYPCPLRPGQCLLRTVAGPQLDLLQRLV